MSNYKAKFVIEASDIYNKLSKTDKVKFKEIEILNTTLDDKGRVIIECLILENNNKNIPYCQKLLSDGNIVISETSDI